VYKIFNIRDTAYNSFLSNNYWFQGLSVRFSPNCNIVKKVRVHRGMIVSNMSLRGQTFSYSVKYTIVFGKFTYKRTNVCVEL